MIIINEKQMAGFKAAALTNFESEMVTHCSEFSPRLYTVLGEAQVRSVVHQALERAALYGFTHKGPVRLFIDMTLLFGSDFDTDPQYPWAQMVLIETGSIPQMKRAEHLHKKAADYIEKVNGADDIYTFQALERIAAMTRNTAEFSSDAFVPQMREQVAQLYPEKAAYLGDTALERLCHNGMERAKDYGMTTGHSFAVMSTLMLAFGHGCADDPLYPWIMRTLNDKRIADPMSRAKRLEKKATTWLMRVIAWYKEDAPSLA